MSAEVGPPVEFPPSPSDREGVRGNANAPAVPLQELLDFVVAHEAELMANTQRFLDQEPPGVASRPAELVRYASGIGEAAGRRAIIDALAELVTGAAQAAIPQQRSPEE